MADLEEIVKWLDAELKTDEVKDYPGALNGLQMENDGKVHRIVSAVDASLAVIEEAAGKGGLLLVHHGMFWQGARSITGPFYRKMKAALDGNLAIYSSHLPLDMHPSHGNNVLLAQAIGLKNIEPILVEKGWPTGVSGSWTGTGGELAQAVRDAVGREIRICPGNLQDPSTVAIVTGGAGSLVEKIAALKVDIFVTGEGPHWSYIEAEERGLSVIYAGHYATETFGVKQLGEKLGEKFDIEFSFIPRSGGL